MVDEAQTPRLSEVKIVRTNHEEFSKWLSQFSDLDLFLLPIAKNKKTPDVPKGKSWKDFKLSPEQAVKRLRAGKNVGVSATGKDIVILDIDNTMKLHIENFPGTLTVRTTSGGYHLYYLNPKGKVENADGKGELGGAGEIRANWKYTVAPGSFVPCDGGGGLYTVFKDVPPVILSPKDLPEEMKPIPIDESTPVLDVKEERSFRNRYGWALEEIMKHDEKLNDILSVSVPADYPSASEADMATLSKLLFWEYSPGEAVDILKYFRYRKKLDRKDYILGMLRKISTTDVISNCVDARTWRPGGRTTSKNGNKKGKKAKEKQKLNNTEVLLKITERCVFYTNQHREVIVEIHQGGHSEYHPLKGSGFRNHLTLEFFRIRENIPCKETLNNFIDLLEAMALHENNSEVTHNRAALQDGNLFIDTGWPDWRTIEITSSGWGIRDNPPVIFQRHNHQQPFDDPVHLELDEALEVISQLWEIFPNCEHRLLVTVWIIASLIPDHPHPILNLHGDPGSVKSTLTKFIQSLVDPSATPLLEMPNSNDDMAIQISHRFLSSYDNQDTVSPWQSDKLARAITGEGSSKRKLYTNEEEHIFSYIRRIILTGINIAARKPELLDRCVLIHLSRLSKDRRKADKEIQVILEHLRPKLFGAILTILSEAFKYYPEIELTELPRMADFARWGEAISRAMGNGEGVFINAYRENIGIQNTEALEANPVGLAIFHLTRSSAPDGSGAFFNGSATELLDELTKISDEELKISTKSKLWPKAPQALTRRINEIRVNLEEEGIEVQRERDSTSRAIIIRKKRNDGTDSESDDSVTKKQIPSSDLGNGNDDNDGVISFQRETPQEERIKPFKKELSSIFSHRPKIELLELGEHFGKYYQGDQRKAIKDFIRFVENGWLPFRHDNHWVYRE